jgi:hypothetical protein
MTSGYVYAFSNELMPGILKIGMTKRDPNERLKEANSPDTWKPCNYKILIAKKCFEPEKKEITLHNLLTKYSERINQKKVFFRISSEEIKLFFDLIDGELWNHFQDDDSDENKECKLGCRDMRKCFTDKQNIRHVIDSDNIWIGKYDFSSNSIIYESEYLSLNKFAINHYNKIEPNKRQSVNAWKECECEINGNWVSIYNLK